MSLAYIRKYYGVPAKRGGRVNFTGDGRKQEGVIVSSAGPYLLVRLDGEQRTGRYHPTWELEYLEPVPSSASGAGEERGSDG